MTRLTRLVDWRYFAVLGALCSLFVAPPALADNDDFIILLDQSKSMLEKKPGDESKGFDTPMQAEKSREALKAIDDVINKLVRKGDYVAVILFGTTAHIVVSQQLQYDHERDVIKNTVARLAFEDRKTDLIGGIKTAGDLISSLGSKERRKILVMVTDGKNDPRPDSPYFSDSAQQQVYSDLKQKIRDGRWRVALVGLGAHTDISDVSRNLGLGTGSVYTFAAGDPAGIGNRLYEAIRVETKANVASNIGSFAIRPETRFLGGYTAVRIPVTLTSSYNASVEVTVNPQVSVSGVNGLVGTATPIRLSLKPGESATVNVDWRYTGARPADGLMSGSFKFTFADGSTLFYPHAGAVSLILPSWWDIYGLWVIIVLACAAVVAALTYRAIRKRQVLEIKVHVLAGSNPIAEPRTLRKGGKIKIANGDLVGDSVPASGLDLAVAATITYLGKRRFRVDADEADILIDGASMPTLEFGLDEGFDLRDAKGKTLKALSLSTAGSYSDDAFGGSSSADPF